MNPINNTSFFIQVEPTQEDSPFMTALLDADFAGIKNLFDQGEVPTLDDACEILAAIVQMEQEPSAEILEVLQKLFQTQPEAVLRPLKGTQIMPLYRAAFKASIPIFRAMLLFHPLGVYDKDNFGCTLLHDAVCFFRQNPNRNMQIVNLVLDMCPDAACQQDDAGDLPLHTAARGTCLEVARKLVAVFPGSVYAPNYADKIPLDLANKPSMIRCLKNLQAYLEVGPIALVKEQLTKDAANRIADPTAPINRSMIQHPLFEPKLLNLIIGYIAPRS